MTELLTFAEARNKFRRDFIRAHLDAASGNVRRAARNAGMSRQNFHKMLISTGIRSPTPPHRNYRLRRGNAAWQSMN